jgi:hypothetical protein
VNSEPFTCPCCGYRTLKGPPGSYDICHVCFWEDDLVQLSDPWFPCGANAVSLADAQQNYRLHGAMEMRFIANVDGIRPGDHLDPDWRPVEIGDRSRILVLGSQNETEMSDLRSRYYWLRRSP